MIKEGLGMALVDMGYCMVERLFLMTYGSDMAGEVAPLSDPLIVCYQPGFPTYLLTFITVTIENSLGRQFISTGPACNMQCMCVCTPIL